jgi:hypothetical protein
MVGWREWLVLPELGVPAIKAKIDTGARSSALHTHDYQVFDQDGAPWVRFCLHPFPNDSSIEVRCVHPVAEFRSVKDSGGHSELRPFIRTRVFLGPHQWDIELNLTNREKMKFRMLLGRGALHGRFRIAPEASYLLSPQKPSAEDEAEASEET